MNETPAKPVSIDHADPRFSQNPAGHSWKFFVLLLGVFIAVLGGAGYVYYQKQQDAFAQAAQDRLAAIAQLKVNQIIRWRERWITDAGLIASDPFLIHVVQEYLDHPTSDNPRTEILQWMTTLQVRLQCDRVLMVDSQRQVSLCVPGWKNQIVLEAQPLIQAAFNTHQIVFSDLHRSPSSPGISLDIWVPLFKPREENQDQARPFALLLMEANLEAQLFPLIQTWPTPSRTAETLLVRREGDEVVYLNELRHRTNTALSLRLPIDRQPHLPAALAILGHQGLVAGIDYRGVPVLAYVRDIPGTPWFIVAKVDQEEIYAPMRERARMIALVVGMAILAASLGILWLWRQRDAQWVKQQFIRDITQRKAYETEIERLNHLYAALSQINQAVVRVTSRQQLFDEVCRALVKFGHCKLAWVGMLDRSSYAVMPVAQHGDEKGYLKGVRVFADDRPEGRGPTGTAIREGQPYICNDFFTDPRTLPWRDIATQQGFGSSAAFPIRLGGEVCGALTVYAQTAGFFGPKEVALLQEGALDISFALDFLEKESQRRRAEAAIHRLNAELEQRVTERTTQLESANRELEAFSYSVSHDLRAPLRAISGFSAILLRDYLEPLPDEARRYQKTIHDSAQHLGRLIDDLLAFSKLGRQPLRKQTVVTTDLVRTVLADLPAEPPGRQVSLAIGEMPTCHADPSLLKQVFVNLLSNALKYTRQREMARIEVGCHKTADGETVFYVRDNGTGFDMQYAHKLFGVFQRLHRAEEFEGTGVGLAIVKQIIDRHGGRVWAEAQVGQGAAFYIALPQDTERQDDN